MDSLRFFPTGQRNCYRLPLLAVDHKFLFRAGFYYGNYDGLSKPPSFRLEIDDHLWAMATTAISAVEPVYHEMICKTRGNSATVCLVNTGDGIPFISSLEATFMIADSYWLMENKTALLLHSRIDYSSNKSIEKLIGTLQECCNRIWESRETLEYLNIAAEVIPDGFALEENGPPWPLLATAIQAKNLSDSIHLQVKFSDQTTVVAYFVLYFVNPLFDYPSNKTNRVEIFIDNQKLAATDVPDWGRYTDQYHVISLYPLQLKGSANVTISPVEESILAPILNAMEAFTVIQMSKASHPQDFSVAPCSIFLYLLAIGWLWC